jgi:hypothetical protein
MFPNNKKTKRLIPVVVTFAMVAIMVMTGSFRVQAAILTFPGLSPCNTTLQACIDSADVGDTVEIATNTPIDESPDLDKSLTLKAAKGFTPTIAMNNTIIASSSGTTNNSFTVQDITLQRGIILVTHGSTGTLTANINNNFIKESFTTNSPIVIRAGNINPPVMGEIFFSIVNNQVTVPEDTFSGQTNGISIQSGNNPAATGIITGNTIVHQGCSQCSAISLGNGNKTLTVDVIGNIISGANYRAGITLFQYSAGGTITSKIINNLISGETRGAGWPAAISISCSEGTLNFSIINNTLSNNYLGILIGGRADLGAVMNGDVVNNIIANNEVGLSIDSDFTATVSNSYNLVYNNGNNGYTPGPGTLTMDPQFIGGGNYRLRLGSPAIDSGICGKWILFPRPFPQPPKFIYTRIAPYEDFEGDPRPEFGSATGCDIGADEYIEEPFPWEIFMPAIKKKK